MRILIRSALIGITIVITLFVLTLGVGLLNHKNFQHRAKKEAEVVLREYFLGRGENVIRIVSPDYSLDQIEVGVIVDKNSYYAVLFVTNGWLVGLTSLNLFIKPKLVINRLEVYKF